MNRSSYVVLGLVLLAAASVASGAPVASGPAKTIETAKRTVGDNRLDAARRYVEQSDRYLHHTKLKRGMKGYGLTVMAGTTPVRFGVEIISVMYKYGPHQDVILARLSGLKLEKSMVISGMSGSPVYVTDPADGKTKMIGAVAYGWFAQNDPICGIQPITQMLATSDLIKPKAKMAVQIAAGGSARTVNGNGTHSRWSRREFLKTFLNPAKKDYAAICTNSFARTSSDKLGSIKPLSTPLMVSGMQGRTFERVQADMKKLGMLAVQAGGSGTAAIAKPGKYAPGSAISVVIVSGDADWAGVGTVTEVVDDTVLAFGHGMFTEGDVNLPISPAYVHTVISGIVGSFKMAAGTKADGALVHDEAVAVIGKVGRTAPTIPMKVSVDWVDEGHKQEFNYRLCRHRWLTPSLTMYLIMDGAWGWRSLPPEHNVEHEVSIDLGKLGTFKASNISSGNDVAWAVSDTVRVVASMLDNPLGPPADIKGVNVKLKLRKGDISASFVDFRLDGDTYCPGQTVTGKLTLRHYRKKRTTMDVQFKLPGDLPEGAYTLNAFDWRSMIMTTVRENPHRFDPKTPAELLQSLREMVKGRANRLYMHMSLPAGGGMTLAKQELPDLPASRAAIINQAKLIDASKFKRSLVQEIKSPYVLSGSATAGFKVVLRRSQTPVGGGQ